MGGGKNKLHIICVCVNLLCITSKVVSLLSYTRHDDQITICISVHSLWSLSYYNSQSEGMLTEGTLAEGTLTHGTFIECTLTQGKLTQDMLTQGEGGERMAIADDSVSFADVRIENSSKIFRCRPLYFPRTFKIRIFQMSEEYDVFSASKCNYSIFFKIVLFLVITNFVSFTFCYCIITFELVKVG